MTSRKCTCCNEKYNYCPNCGNDRLKPAYLSVFCSESCKDLWTALSKVSMGIITNSEAAEIINTLDLKDVSEYVDCVQRDMKEVLKSSEESKKRGKRIEFKPVDESVNIEEHVVVNETEE